MPKEICSLFAMLRGDEPGPLARLCHDLSGANEGSWGEKCVVKLLKNRFAGNEIFPNVYIPKENGSTAELDVVMVDLLCQTGLYIFESKAYGGKIYGQPEQLNWTQYLGGVKSSFYNPIRQNKSHRRYLAKALGVPAENILSFIVFENRADISKLAQRQGENFLVCNRKKLVKTLKKTMTTRPAVFAPDELKAICAQLAEWSNASRKTKKQHVKQVRRQLAHPTCPICGRRLVKRWSLHGRFLACSNYPACRYTRKID